ncbi:unnamed protein product, partial [Coregonus sp. 'balchen']
PWEVPLHYTSQHSLVEIASSTMYLKCASSSPTRRYRCPQSTPSQPLVVRAKTQLQWCEIPRGASPHLGSMRAEVQGVVEYDAEGFTKLTLLLMWKDFLDLPLYFPRDQPTLTFQSVYHFTNSGQLYWQVQKAYFKSFIPQFQEGAFATGKL